MAAYQLTSFGVLRRSDNANIPDNASNPDWQTYQAWVAAGNTADAIPAPSIAAQGLATFQSMLAGGLAITSTGTSSLNATYGTSMQDQINLTALQTAINAGVPFIGALRDITGRKINMTATQFTNIATAVLGFVADLDDALDTALGGTAPTWPATTATIA